MANEYLTRTPTSIGNRKIFTISVWSKISTDGSFNAICDTNTDGSNFLTIRIGNSGTQGALVYQIDGGVDYSRYWDSIDRDFSAWSHHLFAFNSTAVDASDRLNYYKNGVKMVNYTNTYGEIPKNFNFKIDNSRSFDIFKNTDQSSYGKGQLFDYFFVDGQALKPDVFGFYKDGNGYISVGSTLATDFRPGQWMPHAPRKIKSEIERRGGFGTNGFYLPMNDSSNPGADFHCTPNSVITLKGEDLPQPQNGAPATSDAFVSQVRKEIGSLGFAGCVKFDGNGDRINVANSADFELGSSNFCLEAFIYLYNVTKAQGIIGNNQASGSNAGYEFDVNSDGKLMFYSGNGSTYNSTSLGAVSATGTIKKGRWYHVAAVRNSNTLNLYVDGMKVAGNGSFSHTISSTNTALHIGNDGVSTGTNYHFDGLISNARIVKGSPVYTANFSAPKEPLTAITNTKLLCCQSSTSATAAAVAPTAVSISGTPFATTSELTGSTALAVAGAATATGANLVTNGTFDTDTTGWTSEASATLSSEAGRLKVLTTNTSYGSANQTVTGLTVGQRYTFQTNMYYGNDSLVTVLSGAVSANSGWQSADFLWTYSFTAGSTSLLIDLQMASNSGKYGYWDNIILKEEGLPPDYSADIRGSGTNLTAISQGEAGIAYDIPSNYGSVIDFNTDTERLYYSLDGTDYGTNDFTMECWFYPTREANTWGIIMQHATNGSWANGITINARYGNARQFTIYGHNGSAYHIVADPDGYEFNQWYHICAERYDDTLTLYVDGIAKASTDVTGNSYSVAGTPASSAQYALSLAAQSDGSYPSDGYITDARVYKGVAKYRGGFDVPKPYSPRNFTNDSWRTTADNCKNNFCTWNSLKNWHSTPITLTNGNLTISQSNTWRSVLGTHGVSSGKWYYEMKTVNDAYYLYLGWAEDHHKSDSYPSSYDTGAAMRIDEGKAYHDQTGDNNIVNLGATMNHTDIVGCAFDADNGRIWWSKNGTWLQGNPATGASPVFDSQIPAGKTYLPIAGTYNEDAHANFGQNPSFCGSVVAGTQTDGNGKGLFKYAPPSGYLALCDDNLPAPQVPDPGKHFKCVLYTGTGGEQRITGVGFKPDLVWVKCRSDGKYHALVDSLRGNDKTSWPNENIANTVEKHVVSFDEDGFTVDDIDSGTVNEAGFTYVAWCWKAGSGTVLNNDGNIQSTVNANRDAGFSIVSYTGTGSAGTVGHGLGKAPAFILIKNVSTNVSWPIYHQGTSNIGNMATDVAYLDNTIVGTSDNIRNVDDDTFDVVAWTGTSGNGNLHLAYCWAEIEGYSKFGKYTGNNNADGPFVYCGFRPAFIIFKNMSTSTNWAMVDSSRDSNNTEYNDILFPDIPSAANTGANKYIDFCSNGFKLRGVSSGVNSAHNFIFMAWAESPFQTANAK
jgi:hypothetical protein